MPIQWYETADQRLIDKTLTERIRQMMQVQAAIFCEKYRTPDNESQREYELLQFAWYQLSADIAVLQPQSSVPY